MSNSSGCIVMEMLFTPICLCLSCIWFVNAVLRRRILAKVRPVICSNQHCMITNIKHGHQSANQVMMLRRFGEVREGESLLAQRRLISRRHLKHAIKLMYSVCTLSLDSCVCLCGVCANVCVLVSLCWCFIPRSFLSGQVLSCQNVKPQTQRVHCPRLLRHKTTNLFQSEPQINSWATHISVLPSSLWVFLIFFKNAILLQDCKWVLGFECGFNQPTFCQKTSSSSVLMCRPIFCLVKWKLPHCLLNDNLGKHNNACDIWGR